MSPHLNNLWADQGWVGVANVWRVIISVLWAELDLGLLNRVLMLRGPGDCSANADKFTIIIITDLGAGTQSGINPSSICNRNMNTR